MRFAATTLSNALSFLTSLIMYYPEDFERWKSSYLSEVFSNAVAWSKRKWKGSVMGPENRKQTTVKYIL